MQDILHIKIMIKVTLRKFWQYFNKKRLEKKREQWAGWLQIF